MSDASDIPAFASYDNRVLSNALIAKRSALSELVVGISENSERIDLLTNHIGAVNTEARHVETRIRSSNESVTNARHISALTVRHHQRILTDIRRAVAETAAAQSAFNGLSAERTAAESKIDVFQRQMEFNSAELLQWALAHRSTADDRAALDEYEKADGAKLRALRLAADNSARAVASAAADIQRATTDAMSMQMSVERLTDEYRALFDSKTAVIAQWDGAVQTLIQRDRQLVAKAETLAKVHADIAVAAVAADASRNELRVEESHVADVRARIDAAERSAATLRDDVSAGKDALRIAEEDVLNRRAVAERAESDVRGAAARIGALRALAKTKSEAVTAAAANVEAMKSALESEAVSAAAQSAKAEDIEARHQLVSDELADAQKALSRKKVDMLKAADELFIRRRREAEWIAEISGAIGTNRNLRQRIHELDVRSLKQQEMLYNIEFAVQQLERKVTHADGKRSIEDTAALHKEIGALEERMSDESKRHALIASQVKRVRDEVRLAEKQKSAVSSEAETVRGALNANTIETANARRSVDSLSATLSAQSVSHDLLRLEIDKLRRTLAAAHERLRTCAERKVMLETAMSERLCSVNAHSAVQRSRLKSVDDERGELQRQLIERKKKLEVVKKKFAALYEKSSGADGAEGDTSGRPSAAYYLIKAAADREELQRDGDRLNEAIIKAEREIAALANTAELIQIRNAKETAADAWMTATTADDVGGGINAVELARELDSQRRSVSEAVFKERSSLREVVVSSAESKRVLTSVVNGIGALHAELAYRSDAAAAAETAVREQNAALTRAQNAVQTRAASLRKRAAASAHDIAAVSFDVATSRRRNAFVLDALADFVSTRTDIADSVYAALTAVAIHLDRRRPDSAKSASASASVSSASDVSDVEYQTRPLSSHSHKSESVQVMKINALPQMPSRPTSTSSSQPLSRRSTRR